MIDFDGFDLFVATICFSCLSLFWLIRCELKIQNNKALKCKLIMENYSFIKFLACWKKIILHNLTANVIAASCKLTNKFKRTIDSQALVPVYTKTVESIEGVFWLVSQTRNILCYLPPSNSGKNGILVCIHDKWKNHPN